MSRLDKECPDCFPEVDYLCMNHRPENLCVGCNRTDGKLIACALGILCKSCARENGVIFV